MEDKDTSISEHDKALAIMAHDIKAPLSTIVSLLSVIDKGYVTDLVKIRELVERATHKTETLISMVDDILDYTLLSDKSMMKREKVNISEILNDTVSTMKSYVDSRKMTLIHSGFNCAKSVNGNFTFLLRAFNNLVMNAIKYNNEKGKIIIECQDNPNENTITVSISDTGIGIPEEDQDKVFNIFERGRHARKNLNGSLGLGLSLVKQIVDDHDGKIELSSEENVGTTIKITLPLYKEGGTYES
jgi:signal transduction histidine kinase